MKTSKNLRPLSKPIDNIDTDLIRLIEGKKEIPTDVMKKHFNFDSKYLRTRSHISGYSIKHYGDILYLVCIDFDKSPCGERYLITLQSSTLRELLNC
jgi:hypothetical protein